MFASLHRRASVGWAKFFLPVGYLPNFEEEIAFLIKSLNMAYRDIYEMPYSRRQRLLEWQSERIREQQKSQQEAESRMRSSARRR